MMQFRTISLLALTGLMAISGCGAPTQPVDSYALMQRIDEDRATIYKPMEQVQPLKLEEALARAIKYNLDTKVAEMDALIAADDVTLQMLNSLPSVTAKIQRHARSNEGGSSSFSVLTGMESLQPSISQEQYRTTAQLNAEWNLLDAGINVWRGKSVSDQMLIAQERRRKVYQSVVQDAYIAYWRAAVAQTVLPTIESLLNDIDLQLKNVDQQVDMGIVPLGDAQASKDRLLEKKMQLTRMKNGLALADLELKTLISYPLDQKLTLDLEGQDLLENTALPSVEGEIENFERTALLNRPEVREEMLNKRISMRDIKLSLLETIPGLELLLTYNYDSNKYLVYSSWVDSIAGITASINKIITAPTRYKRAQNIDLLADKRRQALIAAIITQVHVARARYDSLAEEYADQTQAIAHSKSVLKRAKDYNDTGLMSKVELLNVKIDSSIAAINKAFAFADAQDAYGRFINTLGVDLWDEGNPDVTIQDYAEQIRKNLYNTEAIVLTEPVEG